MRLFARAMFGLVNFLAARAGLQLPESDDPAEERRARRRTGVRGETFAYWYLRRHGYLLIARNYRVPQRRGEIDLIGWDGKVLAFVEVKTRTTSTGGPPEQAVHAEKQRRLGEMARDYVARRRLGDVRYRFDVLALEARPGAAPVVRLHKGAFRGE
ncbi:MAG: YraN family protein [Terriglobia bacterium]